MLQDDPMPGEDGLLVLTPQGAAEVGPSGLKVENHGVEGEGISS